MRIKKVDHCGIVFDNGNILYDSFVRTGCSWNYADWKQVDELALDTTFDEGSFILEHCDCGFRFGNPPINMFFIPCYSEQNGYYDSDVYIIYVSKDETLINKLHVLDGEIIQK